jgi:phosphoribosylaminoimidazole carboxylase (NCAIR synthetase)
LCAEIHQEGPTLWKWNSEANQVEYVICPARIDDAVAEKQELSPYTFLKKFNHVGLLAVECSKLKTMKF